MTTATAPVRWPYAGRGQKTLLAASLLIAVGSFLPWVMTPVGNMLGIKGGGLWTLYCGCIGLGGALVRWRRVALASAAVTGVGSVVLTGWQVARIVRLSAAAEAWGTLVPGVGLIVVLASGLLALHAARTLQVEREPRP